MRSSLIPFLPRTHLPGCFHRPIEFRIIGKWGFLPPYSMGRIDLPLKHPVSSLCEPALSTRGHRTIDSRWERGGSLARAVLRDEPGSLSRTEVPEPGEAAPCHGRAPIGGGAGFLQPANRRRNRLGCGSVPSDDLPVRGRMLESRVSSEKKR